MNKEKSDLMVKIETDGFEKITKNILSEEQVKIASEHNTHFVFDDDSIGRFIYFVYSNERKGVKFYFADDVLRQMNDEYYKILNHKKGRVDYLKELGVNDIAITSVKQTAIKSISRYVYCQHIGLAIVGPRKCIFIHELAVKELMESKSRRINNMKVNENKFKGAMIAGLGDIENTQCKSDFDFRDVSDYDYNTLYPVQSISKRKWKIIKLKMFINRIKDRMGELLWKKL